MAMPLRNLQDQIAEPNDQAFSGEIYPANVGTSRSTPTATPPVVIVVMGVDIWRRRRRRKRRRKRSSCHTNKESRSVMHILQILWNFQAY